MELAILADDLTGANDSGAQFALSGLSTSVCLGGEAPAGLECDAAALDLESRDIPPDQARERVRAAAAALSAAHPGLRFYKKVDSTMRGSVGAELEGLIAGCAPRLIALAPAYPEGGRTTQDGTMLLNGVPINQTELALIPKSPITHAQLNEILALTTSLSCAAVGLAEVRGGHLQERLEALAAQGVAIATLDATTRSDLDLIAAAVLGMEGCVGAGSAGLALSLAKLMKRAAPGKAAALRADSLLVLAGSISATTRAQSQALIDAGDCAVVRLDPVAAVTDPIACAQRAAEEALRAREGCPCVLVSGALSVEDIAASRQAALDLGIEFFAAGERMALAMAEVMRRCGSAFGGYVMTGGDTAVHASAAVGAGTLAIVGEVEPGIPLCRIEAGPLKGRAMVTKAGALGSAAAFTKARAALLP
ncbi:MAG: hypothetical protein K6A65_07220 [Succinivibrionaceae bacterium]|nr:hypothetical protein [Succinivibrionaceae bacterium]